MQNIIIGILLAALVVWAVMRTHWRAKKGSACCGEREASEKRIPRDPNRAHYPYEITLDIGGMTCENCAVRVENALNAMDGVWATVDIATHTAKVRCKQQPDYQNLCDAVRKAGYVVLK